MVGDWLGPILGSSIYTLLTVVFLLFGDPLSFVALAVVWGLVAFIGGVIIRRRLGATLMMLLLFLSLIPVLMVSSFGMYQKLQEAGVMNPGSNPLEMLPPIPRGFTLANRGRGQ
jgi:high-affinity Fe2+/Pb2+ permease